MGEGRVVGTLEGEGKREGGYFRWNIYPHHSQASQHHHHRPCSPEPNLFQKFTARFRKKRSPSIEAKRLPMILLPLYLMNLPRSIAINGGHIISNSASRAAQRSLAAWSVLIVFEKGAWIKKDQKEDLIARCGVELVTWIVIGRWWCGVWCEMGAVCQLWVKQVWCGRACTLQSWFNSSRTTRIWFKSTSH